MLLLSLPAAASAWQKPDAHEKAQIARAAIRVPPPDGGSVRVTDIRVSEKGPWASARVTYYRDKQQKDLMQDQIVTLHESKHGWRIPAHRNIPYEDEHDLGLAPWKPPTWLIVYLLVCWLLGLMAIWDVLLQPRRAFAAIGKKKWHWLLIESLGAVFLGIFTWAWYAFVIRPALEQAGGNPPRRIVRWFAGVLASMGDIVRSSRGTSPTGSDSTSSWSWSQPKAEPPPCPVCQGGFVWEWNPNDPHGSQIRVPCRHCGGPGSAH